MGRFFIQVNPLLKRWVYNNSPPVSLHCGWEPFRFTVVVKFLLRGLVSSVLWTNFLLAQISHLIHLQYFCPYCSWGNLFMQRLFTASGQVVTFYTIKKHSLGVRSYCFCGTVSVVWNKISPCSYCNFVMCLRKFLQGLNKLLTITHLVTKRLHAR